MDIHQLLFVLAASGFIFLPFIGLSFMIACAFRTQLLPCIPLGLVAAVLGCMGGNHIGSPERLVASFWALYIGGLCWVVVPAIYCLFFRNLRRCGITLLIIAGIWPLSGGTAWGLDTYKEYATECEWRWWQTTLSAKPPMVELQEAKKHLAPEMKRRLREHIMSDRKASSDMRQISDETLLYLDDAGVSITCYIPLSATLAQELYLRHPLDPELAENPSTPEKILRQMSDSDSFLVLSSLCANSQLSDDLATKLQARLEKYLEKKKNMNGWGEHDYYLAEQGLSRLKQRSYKTRSTEQQKSSSQNQ